MLCILSHGCKFFLWPDFCKGLGEWTGGRESGGGWVPGSPLPISLGVVHLQPGSESYLEDTPGNQLQLRRSLYLACRQTQLTSSHPWSVREGVLVPSLMPPFPCVSGGMWSPSPPCLCLVGTSLERSCLTLSLAPFPSTLPASLGSPSRKPSFLPPLPFSFIPPNFPLEYRRSSP